MKHQFLTGIEKLIIIFILMTLLSCEGQSVENSQIKEEYPGKFSHVGEFIIQKKYHSAFQALSDMYKEENDPKVLVMQFRFIPQYFISSTMHQFFLFKDLDEGEDIGEMRRELPEGSYDYTMYDPVSVYEEFTKKNGTSPQLDLAMGEFYQDAIYRYGDQWLITPVEAQARIKDLFTSADVGGFNTAKSLATLAGFAYRNQNIQEAEDYYKRSILLDDTIVSSQYNYAGILLNLEKKDDFYKHIEYAIANYEEQNLRSDAFVMAAQGAFQFKENDKGEAYLLEGYEANPNDYRFTQNLNNLYIVQNKFDEAFKYGELLFSLDKNNPNATKIVLDNYVKYNKMDEAIDFFIKCLDLHKEDTQAVGNLSFHLSLVYQNVGRNEDAMESLMRAEVSFKETLSEDEKVFQLINQLKSQL